MCDRRSEEYKAQQNHRGDQQQCNPIELPVKKFPELPFYQPPPLFFCRVTASFHTPVVDF